MEHPARTRTDSLLELLNHEISLGLLRFQAAHPERCSEAQALLDKLIEQRSACRSDHDEIETLRRFADELQCVFSGGEL